VQDLVDVYNKELFEAINLTIDELELSSKNHLALKLGYGEGIDAMSMPIGSNLNPCAELFFALKPPY